jgi:hypothetical protein
MPLFSTTLSSVGTSQIANINWIGGKPITASAIPGSSTQTSDFTIQYSLDDVMRSSSPAWSGVSSATGQPATHYASSVCYPDGVLVSFLSPIAALRLSSTAISSGALTLKVLQGEGW